MSAISTDRRHINLWELLTDVPRDACRHTLEDRHNIGRDVQALLNRAQRVNGQELRLEVNDQGWTITVYSCFEQRESPDRYLLQVYIPKDKDEAIQFYVEDGHKASMYQRKCKPGKVGWWFFKFIGRTRVFTGRWVKDKP